MVVNTQQTLAHACTWVYMFQHSGVAQTLAMNSLKAIKTSQREAGQERECSYSAIYKYRVSAASECAHHVLRLPVPLAVTSPPVSLLAVCTGCLSNTGFGLIPRLSARSPWLHHSAVVFLTTYEEVEVRMDQVSPEDKPWHDCVCM